MENSPLVSIICTSYNHEAYIKDALEGFVMQKTNFPFEIIVHDDASTDNTASIVKSYELQYPELFANIYQTENQYSKGNGDVGRIVFGAVRGKYIAMCEGDDYWIDPMKLQKQVDFLEANEDYGLVWTDVDYYYQSTKVFKRSIFKNKISPIYNSFTDLLINRAFIAPCTWLFRREYSPNGINEYCDGTFPLILDITAVTKIKYFDDVTSVYRYTKGSASRSASVLNRYKFSQGVHKIQKDYVKKYKLSNKVEEELDLKYYESVFPFAVIMGDLKAVEKGTLILKNNPSKSMKLGVALFLSHFYLGVIILKFIYKLKDKYDR